MNPTTYEPTGPLSAREGVDLAAPPAQRQSAVATAPQPDDVIASAPTAEAATATFTTSPTTPTAPTPRLPRAALLINRNFALLWSGQALSIIGDMIFTTTLVVWIAVQLAKGQAWAPLAVSGMLLAAAVPAFLIGPFAGVFVDRLDKRLMMRWMDGLRAIIVAVMILATGVVPLPFVAGGRLPIVWTLGVIYGGVFLVYTAEQFFRPAMTALIGDLVPEPEQPKAMGLGQASVSLATIIGPALAAPLFIAFGAQWALLINAVSFAVSWATITAIRAPRAASSVAPGVRPSFFGELGAGIRFYAHSRVLMTMLLAIVVAMLGGGALNTLDVFFTTGNLHAPASLYGVMGAGFGVGSLLGAILASVFAQRVGVGRMLWLSLLLSGIGVVALARMTNFGPGLVIYGLIGLFVTALNVAAGPLMLRATPRDLLGRVNSILNPAMSVAMLASTALAGYLDGVTLRDLHAKLLGVAFGPVDTIYTLAGALIILSAFVAMVGLRGVDRPAAK